MIKKWKRLNWSGFGMMMVLCALAAASNENVHCFAQWAILMGLFSLPISLWVLIEFREDER